MVRGTHLFAGVMTRRVRMVRGPHLFAGVTRRVRMVRGTHLFGNDKEGEDG